MLRTERGEIAMRLVIVVVALLAALVWLVPTVLLARQQVDHAGELTKGAGDGPRPERTTEPVAPIERADDVASQAALTMAIRAAQTYFAETGSYQGFDASAASAFDPSIRLTTGPATPGVISERGVSATTIVLVARDAAGGVLCAAANGANVTYGRADARSPGECAGGW